MKVTRVYTTETGDSAFEDIEIPLHNKGEIGSLSEGQDVKQVIFRETPPSYDFDWHNAPTRQYVIMLSGGCVDITVSSTNETRRFKPGDIVLAEDTTGKGHISRCPDGLVRHSIFITLADK
eukprot:Clim_evm16s172 gene=Clim_evmTU16s172